MWQIADFINNNDFHMHNNTSGFNL
jgi:hypothetical protein